ncbi:MAG: ABC transporter ATP-binding protein, partial [Dehalococcoidia bacterium]
VQREFYMFLLEERDRGKTIFLSSHILPEVERVCDRVGIVRGGNLVAVEEVEVLKRRKVRRMELTLKDDLPDDALRLPGAELVRRENRLAVYTVRGDMETLLKGVAALPVEDIVFPEATLEEVFLDFYQRETEESQV